jgi:hypothetical protein
MVLGRGGRPAAKSKDGFVALMRRLGMVPVAVLAKELLVTFQKIESVPRQVSGPCLIGTPQHQ